MNPHLEKIKEIILSSERFSAEEKDALLNAIANADKQWTITDFKLDRTEKVKRTTAILLEETIAELEEKRKAIEETNIALQKSFEIQEKQAKEAQLELSLERVRARAMAMHHSDELAELVSIFFQELRRLEFPVTSCIIWINNPETSTEELWVANTEISKPSQAYFINPFHHSFFRSIVHAWKERDRKWVYELSGKEKEDFQSAFFKEVSILPDVLKKTLQEPEKVVFSASFSSFGALEIVGNERISDEKFDILHRFGKVFDLSYTRFIDIKKAEAQAREATIEMSLERIRSRTMAMQHSSDLPYAANVLFQQVQSLGISAWSAGYCIWDDDKQAITLWMSSEGVIQKPLRMPLTADPALIHFREAWEHGENFHVEEMGGEALASHYRYLQTLPGVGETLDSIKEAGFPLPTFQIFHLSYFKQGFLLFITYEPVPTAWDIFKRFSNVFEQTYTRFLDLQKAEALAREGQIELGLERVRTRAMAMQRSEDLKEMIGTVFVELTRLDLELTRCIIMIFDPATNGTKWWMANSEAPSEPMGFFVKNHDNPPYKAYVKAWKEKTLKFEYVLEGSEKKDWDDFIFSETELAQLPDLVIAGMKAASRVMLSGSFNNFGCLNVASLAPLSAEHFDILLRFAKVFDLTYTRFNDLKQVEARAREAKIELALERVRARTMAMFKSDELADAAAVLFEQLHELGDTPERINIGIVNEEAGIIEWWLTEQDGRMIDRRFTMAIDEPIYMAKMYKGWKEKNKSMVIEVSGQELTRWLEYIREVVGIPFRQEFLHQRRVNSVAFFSQGMIAFTTAERQPPETILLLERFAKVFDLTYTRFLDLQKAESQAREAQIEVALERTRTSSMLMQRSDEIKKISGVFHEQLLGLGIPSEFSFVWLPDEPKGEHQFWATWAENENGKINLKSKSVTYPLDKAERYTAECFRAWDSGEPVHIYRVPTDEVANYFAIWEELIHGAEKLKAEFFPGGLYYAEAFMQYGCFGYIIGRTLIGDEQEILRRFSVEFERAYTRFLDLQKAEAQTREAQIEAALERVRSRTMSMQKSDELKDVIQVVYEQFVHLNIHIDHTGFVMDYKARDDYHIWIADKLEVPSEVTVPYFDSLYYNRFNEAKEKGMDFFAINLGFEEKNRFYQKIIEYVPGIPEESKEFLFSCPGLAISTVLLENVCLYIENFSGNEYSDEENATLMRFGKVFQQTYTRFLDLQKAEAQARESQIEAALERVRSRAMAMQKTEELLEAAELVGKELSALGINSMNVSYAFVDESEKNASYYSVNPIDGKILPFPFVFPHTETDVMLTILSSWERQELFNVLELDVDATLTHQTWAGNYIKKLFDQKGIPFSIEEFLKISPQKAFISTFNFTNGYLFNIGSVRLTAMQEDILLRITKVFDLTYRRFLDLKQAESQAREAQIELALERVRARTMAMQHSHELQDAAQIMFQQVQELGVHQWACGYNIWDEDKKACTAWMSAEGTIQSPFKTPSSEDVFHHFYEAALKGEDLYVEEISGEACTAHYRFLSSLPVAGDVMKGWEAAGIAHPTYQIFHIAYFKQGYLMFITYEPVPEAYDIFKRFAKVFEQTYTRFLDLQKAEAQALETVKRASVDRVRAEIASMRTTSDLEKITPLIWNELTTLGVPFIRCGVFIMDEEEQEVNTYLSNPEGEAIAAFHQPFNTPGEISEVIKSWRKKELYTQHWDEAKFIAFTNELVKQGAVTSGEKYLTENRPTDLYLHFLPFLQGMLYTGNTAPLSDDALQLVQNLADALPTAYARYEDFNKLEAAKEQVDKALTDLKQTQAQLVQAEKMASLGELTAGIAHEIQNPLNFVNNFSEVNAELSEEIMQAAINGNIEEIKILAADIKSNQEKIREHGKRADSIVKGMLQHSRVSSGERVPTDINVLADEYLRLAYHGFRAKDKSFNAVLTTNFDTSIGVINIIPQEIGRVMLNLINNAFYAVAEKVKSNGNGYEPIVTVSSKKMNDKVEISVADNGNGIPTRVLDKIFQPFFTTKPTGQGTGLGLSLSYDIIKAHEGELTVTSEEGKGACFIINLPVNHTS